MCWLVVQEVIIYGVFALFFFGAAINCAVDTVDFANYYRAFPATYNRYYPAAVIATVNVFAIESFSWLFTWGHILETS